MGKWWAISAIALLVALNVALVVWLALHRDEEAVPAQEIAQATATVPAPPSPTPTPTPSPVPTETPPPTVTPVPTMTPTATAPVPTATPSPTPTPTLTPTVTRRTIYIDFGDFESEAGVLLFDWNFAEGPPTDTVPSPSGDRTLRNMHLRGESVLIVPDIPPGDYRLVAEVGDGLCDDSFEILAGEEREFVYGYRAIEADYVSFGPEGYHEVELPGHFIEGHDLILTFRNEATDDCGLAGVYGLWLEPI